MDCGLLGKIIMKNKKYLVGVGKIIKLDPKTGKEIVIDSTLPGTYEPYSCTANTNGSKTDKKEGKTTMAEQKHIPGKPMYSVGDRVSFRMTTNGNVETFDGVIEVVDRFGAWEIDNPREPSYDVLVCNWRGSGEMMSVKHIRESKITKIEK